MQWFLIFQGVHKKNLLILRWKHQPHINLLSWVFSRIATIPFQRISQFQTLQGSLQLRASLQPALRKAILRVGTLIELQDDFKSMREDVLFQEIKPLLEKSQLDMRTQLNYALLLFSTGKVWKETSTVGSVPNINMQTWLQGLWLNDNIVLYINTPGDVWDKVKRLQYQTHLQNLTIKPPSHVWILTHVRRKSGLLEPIGVYKTYNRLLLSDTDIKHSTNIYKDYSVSICDVFDKGAMFCCHILGGGLCIGRTL